MINVLGDSLGTGIVEKLATKELDQMDKAQTSRRGNARAEYTNKAFSYSGYDEESDKTRL